MRRRTWLLLALFLTIAPFSVPAKRVRENAPYDDGSLKHVADLTPSQREIVVAVALGHSNQEIARRMRVSLSTVRNQLTEVYRQTGLVNQRALIGWVISDYDPYRAVLADEIAQRIYKLPPHYCKGKRFVHAAGAIEAMKHVLVGASDRPR